MPRFEVFLLIIDKRALGAEQNKIFRMVQSEAMQLVVVGIAIGVPAALAASRLVASFLYGLRPDDPLTIHVVDELHRRAGRFPARLAGDEGGPNGSAEI